MSYFYSYYYKKPQYNSSVTVLLTGDEAQGKKQVTQTDLNLNSGLISTYGSIAKSANVLSKVIENLGLDISVRNLQKNLTNVFSEYAIRLIPTWEFSLQKIGYCILFKPLIVTISGISILFLFNTCCTSNLV